MCETNSTAGHWLTPRRFALLLLALVLVSFPQVVFGLQTFVYRDFGLFSYPLAFHFRESFWHGSLPLWNPLNCCGAPFLAQWNTQVLYPPALFYLLLPLSWSLGVFCLLHLFWGGLGMFLLARRWTGDRLAAAFAGIVFAFNGLMLTSLMWPATIAGLAWMPWVVDLTERAWREGGRKLVVAAFAGALQMLSGGVETVLLTWVLLGGLWLGDFVRGETNRGKLLGRAGLVVLLISGLSAAQLLPFFELLDFSRQQQIISVSEWPMPLSGWANFLAPLFQSQSFQGVFVQNGQLWTNSYYTGAATVALAAIALWQSPRYQRLLPLVVLSALCLVLALGEGTPVYTWLALHLNTLRLIRFPVKFVILPVFVLPFLAAVALSEKPAASGWPSRRSLWAGVFTLVLGAILALTFWPQPAGLPAADQREIVFNGIMRAAGFAAIFAAWFAAKRFVGTKFGWGWQLLFLLLVWLDLFQQMPLPRTVNRAMYDPGLARQWTPPSPGAGRVQLGPEVGGAFYSLFLPDVTADFLGRRFSLMADCNLLDGIAKCDGFYPLYLSRYNILFSGPYRTNPFTGPALDFLGVAQRLIYRNDHFAWEPRQTFLPLLTAGQQPRYADNITALSWITNADFNPRQEVILPTGAKPFVTASNLVPVQLESVSYSDQRITARLTSPAPTFVVAAQILYPPWRAFVDGEPTRLWPANYSFQAFEVPAGRHQVELVYQDRRFQTGAVISLATLTACLAACATRRRHL